MAWIDNSTGFGKPFVDAVSELSDSKEVSVFVSQSHGANLIHLNCIVRNWCQLVFMLRKLIAAIYNIVNHNGFLLIECYWEIRKAYSWIEFFLVH